MDKNKVSKIKLSEMTGTKWELFKAAVELFSARGYKNVGVRDIANAVGIKSASIYNHFENKDAFLRQMYQFSHDNYFANRPEIEDVLELIPDVPPNELLEGLMPAFEKSLYEIERKIIYIAVQESCNDPRAEELLREIMTSAGERISTVLDRMLELDVIEPIDSDVFVLVFVNFSLAAVSCIGGTSALPFSEWRAGRKLIFSLVRAKNKH